jgi:hypothetical protein
MKHLLLILLLFPALAIGQIRKIEAQYPISAPSMQNLHDGLRGRWKFAEDTDKNNFYEIIRGKPYAEDKYHIKFWDDGGTNPTYEANLHFSKVGKNLFINVPFFEHGFSNNGFFFLKVIDTNADFSKITAAIVHDTTLWNLDQDGVKQHIVQNMDNPAYYSGKVHLYKIQ